MKFAIALLLTISFSSLANADPIPLGLEVTELGISWGPPGVQHPKNGEVIELASSCRTLYQDDTLYVEKSCL